MKKTSETIKDSNGSDSDADTDDEISMAPDKKRQGIT